MSKNESDRKVASFTKEVRVLISCERIKPKNAQAVEDQIKTIENKLETEANFTDLVLNLCYLIKELPQDWQSVVSEALAKEIIYICRGINVEPTVQQQALFQWLESIHAMISKSN